MIIGGVTFDIGSMIKLKTANMYDQNFYSGEVVGEIAYGIASQLSDVATYHSDVAKTITTIGPVTDMMFVVLKTDNGAYEYIAMDWVATGNIWLISATTFVDIRVSNIITDDAHIAQLQQLLTDANYENKVINKS